MSELHLLLAEVYWLGWKNCAGWADRPDLLSDKGSGAYRGDRDNDIADFIKTKYAELSRLVELDPEYKTPDGYRLLFLADLIEVHERAEISWLRSR